MRNNKLVRLVLGDGQRTEAQGYVERSEGRSIAIIGAVNDRGDIAQPVQHFVDVFRQRYPRNHIVFVAKTAAQQKRLAGRFPDIRVVKEPVSEGYALGRMIYRLKAQLLLFVGLPDTDLKAWLDEACKTGAAAAMIEDHNQCWSDPLLDELESNALKSVRLFATSRPQSVEILAAKGIAKTAICSIEATGDEPSQPFHDLIDRMGPILSAKKLPVKYWAKKKLSKKNVKNWLACGRVGQVLVRRNHRLVESLTDLRNELGPFQSILCLGNGPSSEDPALQSLSYDRLFRVNHRWAKRGLLAEPDMIFTGNKSSIKSIGSKMLYGLQNIEAEERLAFDLFPTLRRYAFVTAERLGLYDFETFSTYRPTNGAVMLAAAIALGPKRLIIAGMDMFEHPSGSYPGDKDTPNAYTLNHDRETELQYLLQLLGSYDGELQILSPVLNDYWQVHRRSRQGITARSA